MEIEYRGRIFFFYLGFFHKHSRITGLWGRREGISLTLHYHFHPLNRHSEITRAIIADSCTYPEAGLELGTFDFQAQVANH